MSTTSPGSSSLSESFDRASYDLLRRRLILAMTIGFAISATYQITWMFLHDLLPEAGRPRHLPVVWIVGLGHVVSFAGAAVMSVLAPGSIVRLRIVDFLVMAFNILLVMFMSAAHCGGREALFPVALMLFIHAAFIPCRIRSQAGLALTAILGFPVCNIAAAQYVPGFYASWVITNPQETFFSMMVLGSVGSIIVGVTSVLVTATLYRLQKDLHRAKRLGNYMIEGEIGQGGMGKVYLARHALIRRPTAVKVMTPQENEDCQVQLARFEREVQLSSTLNHPNTITIFDYGRSEDRTFFYAMEYLEGLTLEQVVKKFGPMPSERVAYVLEQVCGSLAEAHAKCIIHRDIKPSNIILTRRGDLYDFVKVLDFGLAKQVRMEAGATGLTKTGVLFGTPKYIAPESIYGTETVDARADLYSIGLVAYWMLTGQPAFTSPSGIQLLIDHVKTAPKRPSEVTEIEVHPELESIIMRCLEKSPDDRYPSATALRKALRTVAFSASWDEERGKEWWDLHMPEAEPTCAETSADELCPQRAVNA